MSVSCVCVCANDHFAILVSEVEDVPGVKNLLIREFGCFRFHVRGCLHDVGPGCSPAYA